MAISTSWISNCYIKSQLVWFISKLRVATTVSGKFFQLFFFYSTNDLVEPAAFSTRDKVKIEKLQMRPCHCNDILRSWAKDLDRANRKFVQRYQELLRAEHAKSALMAIQRYFKQLERYPSDPPPLSWCSVTICFFLPRVAEMDDHLSSPTTRAYPGNLVHLPRTESMVDMSSIRFQ